MDLAMARSSDGKRKEEAEVEARKGNRGGVGGGGGAGEKQLS